ncbi:hypothetical protein ACN265_08955 [Micromonospora sp. WMMD730]|uniref:hypothetical protein n=1 Tax=Micromonospora sp. WMMD730 TaxID=3404128 RepID=UPI003B962C02
MLDEALTALAVASGTAVVQAAGTDAWSGLRRAVARWFARGDVGREQAELERLDQTAGALQTATSEVAEQKRIDQQAVWRTRVEVMLEGLNNAERAHSADQLGSLLAQHTSGGSVGMSAGYGGTAVGRDVNIAADHGSVAAWSVGDVGDVGVNPTQPGSNQG